MNRRSVKYGFENGRGQRLSGTLDMPLSPPLFTGVFAPCFTCTQDAHASAKTCRALAERGVAMLRFDMTGLGRSAGDFSATDFTSRIQDIAAACAALSASHAPPQLLIGHSISGTAALAAAALVPSLRAVATIGAPCDPARVIEKFRARGGISEKEDGTIEVSVMGRPLRFLKSFETDMLSYSADAFPPPGFAPALCVFHAREDDVVPFRDAETILSRAGTGAKLIPLPAGATHLFENRGEDAVFVAQTLLNRIGQA